MSQRKFFIAIFVIALLALSLRFYDIAFRPMHHDEGVNFHFLKQIEERGYYPYSHLNYHGPAFFYLLKACATPSGYSEFGMRLASNLPGIAIVFSPLLLLGLVSRSSILLSMLLLAVSASQVFHSRYAIHETLLVLGTAILAFSSYRWVKTYEKNCLYFIAVAIAIMITTKETFIISGFAVFAATLACMDFKIAWQKIKANHESIYYSAALLIFLVIFVFTGAFRWFEGLIEMFKAVPQWVGRGSGDTGHFKSFQYYFCILIGDSLPAFVCKNTERYTPTVGSESFLLGIFPLAFVALRIWFRKKKFPFKFMGFASIWCFFTCLIYSYVKYKTPWLIINFSLPAIILFSEMLVFCCRYYRQRKIFYLASAASLLISIHSCLWYNWNEDVSGNPFYYVHTSPGMLRMVSDISEFADNRKMPMLVAVRSYWPLPYYLRKYPNLQTGYVNKVDISKDYYKYDIMIIDEKDNWQSNLFYRKYYRLTGGQEAWVHFRKTAAKTAENPYSAFGQK